MFDKLEQLRAKPPRIKKHIAFWSSLGITAVILVFWVTSLSVTLNNQAVAELDGIAGHKAVEEMGWKRRRLALKEIEK